MTHSANYPLGHFIQYVLPISKAIWYTFLSFVLIPNLVTSHPYRKHLSGINYTRRGDIDLGGLIPVHTYDRDTQSCGKLRSLSALKRVEALVYAVDQVNKNSTLLPNTTLGFEIYDTCSYTAAALGESLNFVPSLREDTCYTESCGTNGQKVVGVVGAQRSSSSKQAAVLFGLHHLTQVSFLSTSDELGDSKTYPYFLRTVGPDSFQVKTMIDIILHYNWKYISFLNSDDTYGRSAQKQFTALAGENDICVGITRTILLSSTAKQYDEVVMELLDLQRNGSRPATVVILFVQLEMAQDIFAAATRMKAFRWFIWIGSDGWGNYGAEATLGNEEVAVGSFTVLPTSEILPDFNDYFRSLTPDSSDNPWLPKFISHLTNCDNGSIPCADSNLIEVDTNVSTHETLVMDSVYAYAHALDTMCRKSCPSPLTCGGCIRDTGFDQDALLQYLLDTRFTSLANGPVSFMPNGDSTGRYSIRQLQEAADGNYEFISVGMWGNGEDRHSVVNDTKTLWYLKDSFPRDPDTGTPLAVCSLPCEVGEKRLVNSDNPCCWQCEECGETEIVINGNECFSCIDEESGSYEWPDINKTQCEAIMPDMNDWSTGIITTSTLCIGITLIMTCLYVYNREKVLIKASSRELSYVMFAGIFLAYATPLLWVLLPLSTEICVIHRLLPPFAISLIYVSLAVKTIRLFRIFRASVKSVKVPQFISPKVQVALSLGITLIPVIWVVVLMIFDTNPRVIKVLPNAGRRNLQEACVQSNREMIGVMIWNILMILVCCFFAFLTRKLPANYNETKWIMFCSFCSLLAFLAFSPLYFTAQEPHTKAGYSSLGLIVNASVTLLCLYVVKLYAVYSARSEDLNVRSGTSKTSRRSMHFPSDVPRIRSNPPEFGITRDISSGIASFNSYDNSVQHDTIPEESPSDFLQGYYDANIEKVRNSSISEQPPPARVTNMTNKIDVVTDVEETQTTSASNEPQLPSEASSIECL